MTVDKLTNTRGKIRIDGSLGGHIVVFGVVEKQETFASKTKVFNMFLGPLVRKGKNHTVP